MTKEDWKKGWKELWIRLNTSPKLYLKKDFGLLMWLLKYLGDNTEPSPEPPSPEPTETKTYFPDFAYWQKPGAKKGAQVLISSVKTDGFGYTLNPIDFLLEIGKLENIEVTEDIKTELVWHQYYDEDTDDYIDYWVEEEITRTSVVSGDATLNTLINRTKYLLLKGLIAEDDPLLVKFGILNSIHDRTGYVEPDDSNADESEDDPFSIVCEINSKLYPCVKQTILKRKLDTPVRFYDLEFYIPAADIINLLSQEHVTITVEGTNDIALKFKSLSIVSVFTDVDSYYLPMGHHFYTLLYYKKEDLWKTTKISEKTVKVKYHKTEAILGDKITRLTYREYRRPAVTLHSRNTAGIYVDEKFYRLSQLGTSNWKGVLYKRFVKKSHLKTGDFSGTYKNFRFIETVRSNILLNLKRQTVLHNESHDHGYLLVALPIEVAKRKAKPCNGSRFKLRNLRIHKIYWHRLGKIHRYIYFTQLPVVRISTKKRVTFCEYIMPKIVY